MFAKFGDNAPADGYVRLTEALPREQPRQWPKSLATLLGPESLLRPASSPGKRTNKTVKRRTHSHTFQFILSSALVLFVIGSALGQVQYAITDLGTLGGTSSWAYGINNSGQVVGEAYTSSGYSHAFRTAPNSPINAATDDLGTFGGTMSAAADINDSGQVVGWAYTSGGNPHAFRAAPNSPISAATDDLGPLGGSYYDIYASGINNSGQVVGYAVRAGGYVDAFRTAPNSPINSTSTGLGTIPAPYNEGTLPYGINSSGQVVGFVGYLLDSDRAFLYSGSGPMQDLGTLGGWGDACAYGINDSGQVVGCAGISGGGSHAFRTAPNSSINPATDDLGTLGAPYNYGSRAFGINNNGQVVGYSNSSGGTQHAFVNSGGGPMQELNTLITPSSGWNLTQANAINDKGQIAGTGTNAAGQNHAFLLSPLSTITTTGAPPNTLSDALKPVDPTVKPPSGQLRRWDGSSWQQVTSWNDPSIHPDKLTVVFAHGWGGAINGSTADPTPVSRIASALYGQDPSANILGWDWKDQAAVTLPGGQAATPGPLGYVQDINAEGLYGAARCAVNGSIQGVSLAHELENLHINNSSLQLIGHSNGGAVVGAAAEELALGGQIVKRLTTLDSPNLSLGDIPQAVAQTILFQQLNPSILWSSVNVMQYVKPSSASQVEVYYSNGLLGRSAFGFGSPLVVPGASNVFNGRIYQGNIVFSQNDVPNCDHFRIIPWYGDDPSRLPGNGEFVAGVNWSILCSGADQWVAGNYTEQGFDSKVFGTSTLTQQNIAALKKVMSDGFETATEWFGQHAEVFMRDAANAAARITSGSDGYLYRDISIPADACYLTFDLKVETPDAGDFLTVSLGNAIIYYKGLYATDADFSTVDPIFIGDYAGQNETLLFTLNHVGTGTPSILLDNVTFSAIPEPSALALLLVASLRLVGVARHRQRAWRRACAFSHAGMHTCGASSFGP